MTISLTDAGKRFNREWIFRHLNHDFTSGNSYAIIGPNGSGKSTLLQVLSGAIQLSEGNIQFSQQPASSQFDSSRSVSQATASKQTLESETFYQYISFCAPYLEVIEEMTVREFLDFHHGFKPFLPNFSAEKIIEIVGLQNAVNKQIRYYSSGMKQRVKLAQAIFSNVPIILLDEPCTNLDAEGIELYNKLINDHCKHRLVLVSSNDPQEYEFCNEQINILKWKKWLPDR